MSAAGYIDEEPEQEVTKADGVDGGVSGAEDLSPEELEQVNQYIAFLKSQRKK